MRNSIRMNSTTCVCGDHLLDHLLRQDGAVVRKWGPCERCTCTEYRARGDDPDGGVLARV